MLRKLIYILLGFFFTLACSTHSNPYRQPQSSSFIREIEDWKFKLNSRNLNANECSGELALLRSQITEGKLVLLSENEVKSQGDNTLQNLWQIRLRLHNQLPQLLNCREDILKTFHQLRQVEDLLGDRFYAEKPLDPGTIDYSKVPVPFRDNDFYHGYLIRPEMANQRLEFQAGDIMLSRGISFFSAALTRIPHPVGHFSHLALVHRDDAGKVNTIESYAQTGGVGIFSEVESLKNENARILLLRPRDRKLGKTAADLMMKEAQTKKIPYDFAMDINDDSKMICAEVSYHAYRRASNGKILIPQFNSKISGGLDNFVRDVGMRTEIILSPRDMEIDSRFEMIAEFKDYRILRDMRYRDTILTKIYEWMEKDKYELHHDAKTMVAEYVVWPLRKTPLFPLMRKFGVPEIPPGTPKSFFVSMAQLNEVAEMIYAPLEKMDQDHVRSTGWHMTTQEIDQAVEKIKADDLDKYLYGRGQTFHMLLHAKNQYPAPPPKNEGGN